MCVALIVCAITASSGFAQLTPFDWAPAPPERHGFERARLQALQEDLARRRTKAFLVVRDDSIVWEWYSADHGPNKRHYSASLAKGVVGGLSFAVAMEDGRIAADDPAARYIPSWSGDSVRSRITIRHLGTHTSGIEDAEIPGSSLGHMDLPGWKGAFWQRREPDDGPDPFSIAVYQTPVLFEPGSDYAYSNPGMAALAYAVTASLRGGEHTDIRSLLRNRIMEPIGIEEGEWSIGYGQTMMVDGMPVVANWGGGGFTARALARIGRLLLRRGDWDGRRILSPETVAATTRYGGTALPARPRAEPVPAPAMGWYENVDGAFPLVPRDAVAAAGAQQQLLFVIPSLEIIVVRNGGDMRLEGEQLGFWEVTRDHLLNPLMHALEDAPQRSRPPYPPSPVVQHLSWSAPRSVIRRAEGSDNWPITWAADGHQYTAYGDGRGFEPFVEKKLSLGIARVKRAACS